MGGKQTLKIIAVSNNSLYGNKKIKGGFRDGKLEGIEEQWYEEGSIKSKIVYSEGEATEHQNYWDINGNEVDKERLGNILNDKKYKH